MTSPKTWQPTPGWHPCVYQLSAARRGCTLRWAKR